MFPENQEEDYLGDECRRAVEENVVESHISKLRKKLRERLGFDPIDSKRFLGYRLID